MSRRLVLRGARHPGDVAIADGRIVGMGTIAAEPGDEVVRCDGDIVTAGLVNTHHHGDYTGGNMVFGTEAPIIAHTNIRKRLQAKQPPKGTLPVVTLKTSLSIHFNDEEIRVMHFPNSYTDGDSVIFFTGSNVVRMGDLLFSGRFRCRRRCRRTDKEYRVDLSQISVRREDYSGTRPPFWYQ